MVQNKNNEGGIIFMTAKKRVFLTSDNFSSRIVGTYLTAIVLNPLDFMATHLGTVQNLETISIQNTTLPETAFTGYDALANIGKYCTNNSLGVYYILVDSAVITNDALAKGWITGMQILYNLIPLVYASSESLYTMDSYLSDGTKIGSTLQSSFDVLTAKMDALDQYQNPNLNGYYIHTLVRSLQSS